MGGGLQAGKLERTERNQRVDRGERADRAEELIDAAAGLLLERGLVDLSLRSMAASLGTSHRMLLYYFDSREALVAAALERLHGRVAAVLDEVLADAADPAPNAAPGSFAVTRRLLGYATSAEVAPFLRLQFEAWTRLVHEREVYSAFVDPDRLWRPRIETALRADRLEAEVRLAATLLLAAVYGMFVEQEASGEPLDEAFDLLWRLLAHAAEG
ncbi:MAG: TetR/AcrR family transcriptional regulator [Acidimicrobiales bacterium]